MDGAWIIFLEAGGAMGLLIFIVWWTMFSTPDIARRPPTVVKPNTKPTTQDENSTEPPSSLSDLDDRSDNQRQ